MGPSPLCWIQAMFRRQQRISQGCYGLLGSVPPPEVVDPNRPIMAAVELPGVRGKGSSCPMVETQQQFEAVYSPLLVHQDIMHLVFITYFRQSFTENYRNKNRSFHTVFCTQIQI